MNMSIERRVRRLQHAYTREFDLALETWLDGQDSTTQSEMRQAMRVYSQATATGATVPAVVQRRVADLIETVTGYMATVGRKELDFCSRSKNEALGSPESDETS